MALAPSEKHLEDWIVDNPLAFGEVVENDLVPEDYRPENRLQYDDERWIDKFFSRLIARQTRFPDGISDLIYRSQYSLNVVELKQGRLDFKVLGQCLRYMYNLREILYWTRHPTSREPMRLYTQPLSPEESEYPSSEINGMIVGHSISDPNLIITCRMSNIAIVTYDYMSDENIYRFERLQYIPRGRCSDYQEYAYGIIGEELRNVVNNLADRCEDNLTQELKS